MIFNSFPFLLFFIIYLCANYLISQKNKIYLIIIGSTIFYGYLKPQNIWIPYLLALIGFIGGEKILKAELKKKKFYFFLILILLYLPLILFKYQDFIYNDILCPIFGLKEHLFLTSIPLGISFITFTITAYLIDVYKNRFNNKVNFDTFLAYILFFPQLIAGPILRPQELIPQLKRIKKIDIQEIIFPITIFTIGIVKKVIFADSLAKIVEPVFDSNISDFNFLSLLLGIYGFAVQIYCDFSGYTDMAIGLGLLLGIELPINFANPYSAKSVQDFWRKWHITLSNFLRDYIYIPLGGNRVSLKKQISNITVTMLLGGLWHGANWSFVIWGLIHGLGLSFLKIKERLFPNFLNFNEYVNIFLTFNFVSFSWIFFRANSIKDALHILNLTFKSNLPNISMFFNNNILPITLICFFLITHQFDCHEKIKSFVKNIKKEIFIPFLIIIWLLIVSFSTNASNSFIYFDF